MAEIEKFDPNTLMQGVKDRIKATFVSLIPDAQWELMCKLEIDKFFKQHQGGYNSSNNCSEFTSVVYSVLSKDVEIKVKEILNSEEFSTGYNGIQTTVSAKLREEIIKRAPEMFAAFIENSVASTINQMKYR